MKHIPNIVAGILGLLFIVFGLNGFLHFIPLPSPPEGSHAAAFLGALGATGYFGLIKALEIIGGLLVAIPKTRNFGLLALGPIIINILAFHIFITGGHGLFDPIVLMVSIFSAYLLWDARAKFCNLMND